MPEPPSFDRWRLLGRLLPRDVRERVFEPALADLVREWLTNADAVRSAPFGLYALGTYLGCLPPALLRPFVRRGRLTALGKASVWTMTMLAVAVLVIRSMTGGYAQPGP